MNVSMQDGFNIAWKLGQVVSGRSPQALLDTYSAERQEIAKNLIDFDREWSTLMATPADQLPDPSYLEDFYVKTAEFPAGFMTQYRPSLVTASVASGSRQELAEGFPVGKRFKSVRANRRCDAFPVHIGHEAVADGRWRLYVFADAAHPAAEGSGARALSDWLVGSPDSPFVRHRREGEDFSAQIEPVVVYQQEHTEFEITDVPAAFRPRVGALGLEYWDRVYASLPEEDAFLQRERPDLRLRDPLHRWAAVEHRDPGCQAVRQQPR